MSMQTIENPADWRVGDHARIEWPSGAVTEGLLWGDRNLFIKGPDDLVRFANGDTHKAYTITVTREVPDLPTKAGSVILASEVRGETFDPPVAMSVDLDNEWTRLDGEWMRRARFHQPAHITKWVAAKVVPA